MNAPTNPRFEQLPQSLRRLSRLARLGPTNAPALLCHPDWQSSAPVLLWLHGRTVYKELDPGRYARLVRAGIAVCAIDLPGHGERADSRPDDPQNSPPLIAEALAEIDPIVESLRAEPGSLFDTARIAIGGMSLGGMITLRRLCDAHPFAAASVEATTGALALLYSGEAGPEWPVKHDPAQIAEIDASQHLAGFRPIPLLVLHSEKDEMVPWRAQQVFLEKLRAHYAHLHADPNLIEVHTWPETGAPAEHIGFGRVSNEAKMLQVDFLKRALGVP